MSDELKPKRVLVFKNIEALAAHLDVSTRRLRKLRQQGRLNYTNYSVMVDAEEVERVKERQAAFNGPPMPYVPRSFRGNSNIRGYMPRRRTRIKNRGS